MWAAIFIIILAIIMVLAAPKPNIENARAAKLGDFQFPRSKEGDPVPWIIGRVRARSPVSLWYGDYEAEPIIKNQKTGMFSSKRVTIGYKYNIGLDLCFCKGPNVQLRKLWFGKYLVWTGNLTAAGEFVIDNPTLYGNEDERGGIVGTIDYYPGSFTETRNAYLAEKADPEVPAYVGQCRLVFRGLMKTFQVVNQFQVLTLEVGNSAFYFGNSTSLEPINAELQRMTTYLHPTWSILPGGDDVNPMECLYAGCIEKGMLEIKAEDIDLPSWIASAQTCYNEGLGMSFLVQTAITGKDIAEECLRIADGILYQDPTTGKIVSKLIRNDYDIEDLPILDDSIIKELTNFSKTTWAGTYNQARVKYRDRAGEYAEKMATAQDFANINFQQKVRSVEISMPGCYVNEAANKLVARQLAFLSVPLFSIEIRCNRQASQLKPGGCFVFNWAPYGISNMVMRIQKIDLGTLTDGTITINAVQDVYATNVAVFAPPGGTGWTNPQGAPEDILDPALFELPFEMTSVNGGLVATVGTKAKTSEQGYHVYSGTASGDSNLTKVGSVSDFTPSATITGALGMGGEGLLSTGVPISNIKYLNNITQNSYENEVYAGQSIALIRSSAGDELIAWHTLASSQIYGIIRGVYGSLPKSHPAGAKIYFLSDGYGVMNADEPYVSAHTRYAKLVVYNSMGEQTLADAVQVSLPVTLKATRPAPPAKPKIDGTFMTEGMAASGNFTLSWAHRSRLDAQVRRLDEASVTPETGTKYTIEVRNASNNALLIGASEFDATSSTIQLNFTGNIKILLWSRLNGLDSNEKWQFTVAYTPGGVTTTVIKPDTTVYTLDGGGA